MSSFSTLEFTNAEDMIRHYAALKKRVYKPKARITTIAVPAGMEPENHIAVSMPRAGQIAIVREKRDWLEVSDKPNDLPELPAVRWGALAWKRIVEEVARKHKVATVDLMSARRKQKYVDARHELFWRLKTETTFSLPQIGRICGGRDHTTVLHGIRKYEETVLRVKADEAE